MMMMMMMMMMMSYHVNIYNSSLKMQDPRTIRRIAAAETFKKYDTHMEGHLKTLYFNYIYRDLVEQKYIASKEGTSSSSSLMMIQKSLDKSHDGLIYFGTFIAWIDSVINTTCYSLFLLSSSLSIYIIMNIIVIFFSSI